MDKSVKQKLFDKILGGCIDDAKAILESSNEMGEVKYASSLLCAVSSCDPDNQEVAELLKESERKQEEIAKNIELEKIAEAERARQEAIKREEERAAAILADRKNKIAWVCFFGFIVLFIVSVIILNVCNNAHSLETEVRGDAHGLGVFVGICNAAAAVVPILACFCVFLAHHPKKPWTIPFPILTLGIVIFTIAIYAPLDSNFNPATTISVQAVSKSPKSVTSDTVVSEIAFTIENKGKYDIDAFSGAMTFIFSAEKYARYNVTFFGGYEANISKRVAFTVEETKSDCPFYNTSLKAMGIQLEILKVRFGQLGKVYDFSSGIMEIKRAGESQ